MLSKTFWMMQRSATGREKALERLLLVVKRAALTISIVTYLI
jgi:hypothetical protein